MALRRPLAAVAASIVEATGSVAGRTQQGAALQQLHQQTVRGAAHNAGIGVDVPNGNVDRAWRQLSRKLREEGYLAAAQSREYFVKPSEQRKKAASAARKRFQRQEFNEMLQWIMRRRSRGF